MHSITIKEVAEKAGVSIATVSHVLNKTRYVSPETSKKVQDAIQNTNYIYNSSGRILRSRETRTIGVIIPNIANALYARIVQQIERKLDENGFQMLLCVSSNDAQKERRILNSLEQGKIDGIAIIPSQDGFDYSELTIYQKYPFVFFSREPSMDNYCGVFIDMYDEAYQAVEKLIQQGYKRIGCLIGNSPFTTKARFRGYEAALKENNLPCDPTLVYRCNGTMEAGGEGMKYFLNETDCSAVFSANSKLTLGAIQYINEEEINLPQRIAFIGRCSSEWPSAARPKITIAKEPMIEMGTKVSELLLKQITDKKKSNEKVILKAAFSERSSY